MARNTYLILSIILFFTISTTSTYAFNITYFLEHHTKFSTFNNLLTRTDVAAKINKQGTVTVLVVDNTAVGPLEGEQQSAIGNILATHVLLDYYDKTKLDNLEGKSVKATNLFQQTGISSGAQGLLNITNSGGEVTFASAVKGAPQDSKMVKVVSSKPFHISVIQLNKPILTPGLGQVGPASPSGSPKVAPMAAPPPRKAKEPAPVPGPAPATPDEEEAADGPTTGTAAPAPSIGPAPGPAPQGDEADNEEPVKMVPPKNGGGKLTIGGGVVVVAFMGLLALSH